jgi:hypothetical protein
MLPTSSNPQPMPPVSRRSFRVKVPALWRQVFPIGLLTAVLLRVGSWLSGQPFSWPSTLPLALAAGSIVLAFYVLRPVQADAEGMNLLSRLGHRRFVRWGDMREVGFGHRMPLEPALRITDVRGGVHWIPRHTKDLRQLQRMSATYGGPAHPLALKLESPLCDAP